MAKLNMVQAINLGIDEEMARDESVIVMGEDVGKDGGVFRVTDGLFEKYGERRVMDTPIAESAIVGSAVGMCFGGMKPVTEIQFSGFAFLMMGQLEAQCVRYRSRTQGQRTCPMVIRMPMGGKVRAFEHHSESREATFASMPGVKVVTPSGPRNARGLIRAAIQDPDTVVFMEPKHSYRAFREDVPDGDDPWEIGKCHVMKEGSDLTVITWAAMVPYVQKVVAALEEEKGVSIELIDVLTIAPLDHHTIIESVKKTGRCVIITEAPRNLSLASEIIAQLNDFALEYLQAPVRRVNSPDVITPYFARENLYFPSDAKMRAAIEETLSYQG